MQIEDEENDKTIYIDSRSCETINDDNFVIGVEDIPKTLMLEGETIKLVKNKEDFTCM